MKQQTMKIYAPRGPGRYEMCYPVDPDGFETITVQVTGQPCHTTWQPLAMELYTEDEKGRELLRSDSPWMGEDALILRPTAILALGQLFRAHGELLPLRCEGHELWIFNPRLLDALDEEASTVERFSTGHIMMIDRYVFRPEVIRGVPAFKIPQLRASPTFVSQQFVDQWNAAQLNGLEFIPVWEHEN